VAFVHHFGAALNGHTHFHCLITDGLFAATPTGEAVFYAAGPLTDADVARVQAQVRRRVLAWLVRHGYMEAQAAAGMLAWRHSGGFSVDASVRLAAWDRQGVERLARYCARPSFSSARLDRLNAETLAYRLKKPLADGRTCLTLTPLELLSRLAALIPPPRQHRTRYHGVLAPHARLRSAVIATAGPSEALACRLRTAAARMELASEAEPPAPAPPPSPRTLRYAWAMLLARIYEVLPLVCPRCGSAMRILAFVTEAATVRRILEHVGECAAPSPLSPSRAPPWAEFAWEEGGEGDVDQRTQYSDEPW